MKNAECAHTILTIPSLLRRDSTLLRKDTMRILIVEDDTDLGEFIGKGLREERYAVDLAVDGEEGLELAGENPYQLIILDIMLPKLDGLTVCRRLRANGNTTPILLLTARDSIRIESQGWIPGRMIISPSRLLSWSSSPESAPSCDAVGPSTLRG